MGGPTPCQEWQPPGASVTVSDADETVTGHQQHGQIDAPSVANKVLDPQCAEGAPHHGLDCGSAAYGAVAGSQWRTELAREGPYAPMAGRPLLSGATLEGGQQRSTGISLQQHWSSGAPDAGDGHQQATGADAIPCSAGVSNHGTNGQQTGIEEIPQESGGQGGEVQDSGIPAVMVQHSTVSGMDPLASLQSGTASEDCRLINAQYNAAALTAQYYATLAGAPQYLAVCQPIDALQQAALAQYSLYAAAYAAQASSLGLEGTMATGTGGPSTAWITNRLIEREKARLDRNFDEADKIRAELRQCGVEVDDRLRTWSARDGRRGHRPNHNDMPEVE